MKLELISFETAKLAKEKGFNHPVNDYYMGSGRVFSSLNPENHNKEPITKEKYSSPTQHLLQKWLREEKCIDVFIMPGLKRGYEYLLQDEESEIEADGSFDMYEQALEHGLKEALNMIE